MNLFSPFCFNKPILDKQTNKIFFATLSENWKKRNAFATKLFGKHFIVYAEYFMLNSNVTKTTDHRIFAYMTALHSLKKSNLYFAFWTFKFTVFGKYDTLWYYRQNTTSLIHWALSMPYSNNITCLSFGYIRIL